MLKRITVWLMVVCMMLLFCFGTVGAEKLEVPQTSFPAYIYDYWGKTVPCPSPYAITKKVSGIDIGTGDWKNPNDIFSGADGTVYIAVSGNDAADNRIEKLDSNLNLIDTFYGYTDKNGANIPFTKPQGIFVLDNGEIYLADSISKNIIHMTSECRLIRIIPPPTREDNAIIDDEFTAKYAPSKLVVDYLGGIHVVASHTNEGIVEFDSDGKFTGFLAAGKVNADPIQIIWRKISTKEQLERMNDFVPIEYNNISLDKSNFIFATSAAIDSSIVLSEIKSKKGTEQGALVRRLNMLGQDILGRSGYVPPVGDTDISDTIYTLQTGYKGISQIADVSCGENDTYTLLDSNRGHIFTYDSDGYLLFAFSGPDVTAGGFRTPISIAQAGEALFVLDANTRTVTKFSQTDFAKAVLSAVRTQSEGKYQESAEWWQEVLNMNANYDLAYIGLGKAAYRDGDYKKAMDLFQHGNNRSWFSKAYAEYRKALVAEWFAPVAMIGIALCGSAALILKIRSIKKKRNEELD